MTERRARRPYRCAAVLVAAAALAPAARPGTALPQPVDAPPAVAPAPAASAGGIAGAGLRRVAALDREARRGARAVAAARAMLGTPYRYGGQDASGFDCSGLVRYAYARAGLDVPRVTTEQYAAYPRVAHSQLRPGDLVFFDGLGHDGIYAGDGRFIHAPSAGDVVKVSRLDGSWYAERYEGAVRPG